MPSLESVVSGMIGAEDTYISQSSFWSCSRKTVHFKQTRAAWVDLDLYNIDKKVDGSTIAQILRHAVDLGIPAPTAVIASGRGCYLKWMFHTPVTQQQLPVWQTLQAVLTAAFSSLAADANARDASRVLRLLETRNSKGGGLVQVIDGCGVLYDFNEVCRSVEALQVDLLVEVKNKPSVSQSRKLASKTTALSHSLLNASARGDVQALNLFAELHQPIMLDKLSNRSLNWGRFCDLRNLYEQRGGIPVGERDTTMFWMLNFLSHSNVIHASNWEREIAELQQAFPSPESFSPLQDGSMSSLLQRVRDHENGVKRMWKGVPVNALYRPGNQFLIKAFAIEPEEMKSLSTIISPEEKQTRRDGTVEGRSERRAQRSQWRDEVRHAFEGQRTHLAQLAQVAVSTDSPIDAADAAVSDGAASLNSGQVNLKALAIYLGVERTRVTRYWCRLQEEHLQAEHPQTISPVRALTKRKNKEDKALSDINPLETARLAKLATFKAIEAKEAQFRLVFERRKLAMQNTWARRKLAGLTNPMPMISMDDEDNKMAVNSTKLSKKMALLDAALSAGQGSFPGDPVASLVSAVSSAAATDGVLTNALAPQNSPCIESNAQRLADSPAVVLQAMSTSVFKSGMVSSTPHEKESAVFIETIETLANSAISNVQAEVDLSSEGYDTFFDSQQDYEWIDANLPRSSRNGLNVGPVASPHAAPTQLVQLEPQVSTIPTPQSSVPAPTDLSQPQTPSAVPKMSAAERLKATMVQASKSKASRLPAGVQTPVQIPPPALPAPPAITTHAPSSASSEKNLISSAPVLVVANTPMATPVVMAAKPLFETVSEVAPKANVSPVPLELVTSTPSFEGGSPSTSVDRARAAPLTASERLRMVAERVAKLPPLQRESKGSTERVPLVEGAVGAPKLYPSESMWPSHVIPPGSRYSAVEWQAAREDASRNRFEVVEIQSAKKCFLLQIAIPEQVTSGALVAGKWVTTTCDVEDANVKLAGVNSLMRQFYSNCLLVSMDSFPEFPGAVEADFINNSVRFRVIRPRTDYLDSNRAYRVGAAMHMQLDQAESYLHDGDDSNEIAESQISAPSA